MTNSPVGALSGGDVLQDRQPVLNGEVKSIDDRYQLLDVIASGGMATVWKARDTRLGRVVALKRPHPAAPGVDADARLLREAKVAASLNHPNLITVYDFGTDEEGPYLVMELADGPTLQQLAAGGEPIDPFDIGSRLAEALAVIHRAGIVHRDVKPSNVLMTARGPLLTDFGIARHQTAVDEITAQGTMIGTPTFAAPEVMAGEPPTPASDIYSLGIVVQGLLQRGGISPDEATKGLLESATNKSARERPDAASFAQALKSGAPTVIAAPVLTPDPSPSGGSTMILPAPPPQPATPAPIPAPPTRRRMSPWLAALLGALAVGTLVLLGLAAFGNRGGAVAVPFTTTTSTTLTSTTTASSSTTSSTIVALTVLEVRDRLEEILDRPPRSDLSPKEVKDALKKIDEAIEAAEKNDLEKTAKKLSEVVKRIEDKLDGAKQDDALTAVATLADLLGVELDNTQN